MARRYSMFGLALALGLCACSDSESGARDVATEPDAADAVEDFTADASEDAVADAGLDPDPDLVEDVAVDVVADADVGGSEVPPPIAELSLLLDAADPEDYPTIVQDWIDDQSEIPITYGRRALFLWQGEEPSVKMVGDATGWNAADSPSLVPLDYEGANLQYLEQRYEADARLDYKLVVGSDWRLDPLNPNTMAGGFGPNSELAMPDYETPAEADVTGAPQGSSTSHSIESEAMGDTRAHWAYVPPGSDVQGQRPVVIFHDGGDYLQLINTRAMLDGLVATGDVGPLVAVFAVPNDRSSDYDRNDNYVDYLAEELIPWIRENLNAGHSPATTGTFGPSFGGLAACYTAITRPEVFGLGACQSGAYSLDDDAMIDLVESTPKVDVRLHMVVGTYELAVSGSSDEGNLLEAQRRMAAALTEKGYEFVAEEYPQGHSWGLWRDQLPAAIRYLYETE